MVCSVCAKSYLTGNRSGLRCAEIDCVLVEGGGSLSGVSGGVCPHLLPNHYY